MIKLHLDGNKGIVDLKMSGNTSELIADSLTLINMVYTMIQEQNKMEAEYYKHSILSEIETAFITDSDELKNALNDKFEGVLQTLVEKLLGVVADKPDGTYINEELLAELRKAKLDENS